MPLLLFLLLFLLLLMIRKRGRWS